MQAIIQSELNRQEENKRFGYSFLPGTLFVALLWLISLLTYLTDASITWLGILPRNFFGLIGIICGPLIHADLLHLLSNSFPFVLLSGFILFQFKKKGIEVIVWVYFLSGLLTWFIGRQAYHVGASGVIYGMASFLLFRGFIGRDRASLAISLAILFLYSGLFYGLFPGEERVSWEGHVAGLLAGFFVALSFGERRSKKKSGSENVQEYTIEQRHTSHTLGQNYLHYHMHYTIPDSKGTSPINYTINSNKSSAELSTTLADQKK